MNSCSGFNIRLLGSPVIMRDDGVLITGRPAQRHRLALLALLTLAGDRGASRDRLIGYLWPESDAARARQLLNQAVYQLRRALGDDAIVSTGDEVRLNPAVLRVDVAEFEAALKEAEHARAAALYQGPLLDGFFLSEAPEFEQRIERERQRLSALYAQALESLAAAAETGGNYPGAVTWWQVRSAHDPYDSRVALRLMLALDGAGNRAGAIQHAATHMRVLQQELGIAAAPEFEAVAERLRAAASAPAAPPIDVASSSAGRPRPAAPDGDSAEPSVHAAAPVARLAPRRVLRLRYALVAIVAASLGASSIWALTRDPDMRWLVRYALPRIEEYLAVADWESAYTVAREAERRVPGSPEIAELWPRLSWRVSIDSEPSGAAVFRQAYDAAESTWEELGRTPLEDIRIPYGLSRIRFELDGYRPLVRALGGAHINWQELEAFDPDRLLVGPERFRLDADGSLPHDMIRVPGGKVTIGKESITIADFLLDTYEVTNAQYKRFLEAGGHQRPELWDPVVLNGNTVAWHEAMALFVDRTGRPGPSTWEAGDYRHGEDDLPVSGVSWYEAAAYARFAGRELPTAHHWQHALANAMFPWLLPASNFSGERPRRVTESRAMTHVGAYDMAGNVREWTASTINTERIILGGSWNDPYYIAGTTDTSAPPLDRSPGNGFRLAITHDEPLVVRRLRAPVERTTTSPPVAQEPVADDVYAAYSRVFDYDRRPLNAALEAADTSRLWIRERIRFDAAYGTERMLLHLYVPRTGKAPFQTVVYWPGWDTFSLDDIDEYFTKQVDFIVKGGRAVAFPIYRGIFERRLGDARRRAEFGTAEYRDNTIYTVKDLRRSIDYLETRADIDRAAIAFFGYSWGGVNGPVALAQDPRMRVAIIKIGLLPPMAATPEVDPLNSLPRVRVPTLMFSGEFDAMVPSENSQRYFDLLGTAPDHKRRIVAIGGHFIPRQLVIRESLDWLDRYLGPVEH